ncbi:MAG: hypothetical protein IH606_00750 [Burkholderiales bacterium]|nr:hypothetical protein [Burkholderiales bacterium]
MATVKLSGALRTEYQELFDACQIRAQRANEVEKLCSSLIGNKDRYMAVAKSFAMPWHIVAVIHNMESSQNFNRHLHNGDPLTARTRNVPAGRPKSGEPPFSWEASAADALGMKKFEDWTDWTIPGSLYRIEGYNGWGYRLYHPDVKSPYLWSGSNQYSAGKYVSDGTWSATASSAQCGAAVLMRRLAERGDVETESHVPNAALMDAMKAKSALLRYSPKTVTPGGEALQRFLNQFPGIFLKLDGKLGKRTSDACQHIFGNYLVGDPRETS